MAVPDSRFCAPASYTQHSAMTARNVRENQITSATYSFLCSVLTLFGVARLIANHLSSATSKAHQKSGSFPPPALPSIDSTMTPSDTRLSRRPATTLRPLPSFMAGLPQLPGSPFRHAVPTTPMDQNGCICWLLPRPTRPSPLFRRVGVHTFTFEACSGFTHITVCRIAQPPKAAFVTRLRPNRLPGRAARQLPSPTNNCLGGSFLHW